MFERPGTRERGGATAARRSATLCVSGSGGGHGDRAGGQESDREHGRILSWSCRNGNTQVFQLAKTYFSGEQSYLRPILKPVKGTVKVALAGDPKVDTIEYEVNSLTGEVTFVTAPDIDVRVTAGFEFDVPVRFDTDRITTSAATFNAGDVPSVPVIEVRL